MALLSTDRQSEAVVEHYETETEYCCVKGHWDQGDERAEGPIDLNMEQEADSVKRLVCRCSFNTLISLPNDPHS